MPESAPGVTGDPPKLFSKISEGGAVLESSCYSWSRAGEGKHVTRSTGSYRMFRNRSYTKF